jgi:hypothetical protein
MLPQMKNILRLLAVAFLGSCFLPAVESHPRFPEAQAKPAAEPPRTGSVSISFERMGGFAGIYEKYSIYPDGHVTNEAGQTQQVPVQALEGIRRRVEALDLPKSCEIRVSAAPCSDCFQYRIVLLGSAGLKTLVLYDPMTGFDSISKIARELRDLVLGLKWK